ncbi:MAG: hypothetical protein CMJ76_02045 [Planctomycetaceae bacterium]|mgnify:CR=1 FL=1|nr:hypothetical protein [Planctomycetaceae bacterium]|tara:strand:+ start:451 stop:900 length:450 start_codon:yes stop_codon:yes gene_type:complete
MKLLGKQKSGSFILLLFLTAQIILPAICCCGFSTGAGEENGTESASRSCPSCIEKQDQQGEQDVFKQVLGTDDSQQCPCKKNIAKQLLATTKATIQTELQLSLDTPYRDIVASDIIVDLEGIKQIRAGPSIPAHKSSQNSQSISCCWLC